MILPAVAVVIRSKDDASLIPETLSAVRAQDYPGGVRRIHIDSGSADGTVECIERSKPDIFVQIRAENYIPGQVLNTGMKLSSEEWVVFLNSDATPVDRFWLKNLMTCVVENPGRIENSRSTMHDPRSTSRVGAVFGGQIPRSDCEAVYAHDYERCFGPERESARWPHFFSMVSSAVNRKAWLEQPFREDMRYSEDEEWSFRIRRHGWVIRYVPGSVVMHSHNYTLAQARKRHYGEGFALGATPALAEGQPETLPGAVLAAGCDAFRDFVYCARRQKLSEWPHAVAVRLAQRLGKREGLKAGRGHYAGKEI